MEIRKNKSLKRSIFYIFALIFRKEFLVAYLKQFNLKFKIKVKDVVGRHIYKYQAHETELSNWVIKNINKLEGDILLDIGANIGWYSILFYKSSSSKFRIIAFEPDDINFNILKQNLKLNNIENVEPHNIALSEFSGKARLYRYGDSNLGRHSMLPINGKKKGGVIEVNTVNLDDFLKEKRLNDNKIKILKIDIEGYEYIALSKAKNTLKNCSTVICEYSPVLMRKNNISPKKLIYLLNDSGLKPYILKMNKLKKISKEELLSTEKVLDILWIRN